MKKGLPFKAILSQNATATILFFVGRKAYVSNMLRVIDHQGRAYIVQQGGLPGFLSLYHTNIMSAIGEMQEKNELETLYDTLAKMTSHEKREAYLKEESQGDYAAVLKLMGRYEDRKQFCKESIEYYTIYIVDYFEPWLDELRSQGKLKMGDKRIKRNYGDWCNYKGELDEQGRACGRGRATYGHTYEGTFLDDARHGIGKQDFSIFVSY